MSEPQEVFEFENTQAAQASTWIKFVDLMHVNFLITRVQFVERFNQKKNGMEPQAIMTVLIDKTGEEYATSTNHAAVLRMLHMLVDNNQLPVHCTLAQSDKENRFGNKTYLLAKALPKGTDNDLLFTPDESE